MFVLKCTNNYIVLVFFKVPYIFYNKYNYIIKTKFVKIKNITLNINCERPN